MILINKHERGEMNMLKSVNLTYKLKGDTSCTSLSTQLENIIIIIK